MKVKRALASFLVLMSLVLLAPWGYAAFIPVGADGQTTDKPQSKLWFNDGAWWGILPDGAGMSFYKLVDGTLVKQTFAGAQIDTRNSARADVLSDGTTLFVLMYRGAAASMPHKFSYDPATQTYTELADFPVNVSLAPLAGSTGRESATLAKDSTGKLWIAYDPAVPNTTVRSCPLADTLSDAQIRVRWSADHKTWSAANETVLETPICGDDLAAVVAFNGRIGVMWSNQLSGHFGFRVHVDGDPETTWGPLETVGTNSDDHVHITVTPEQDVLAAVKAMGNSNEISLYMRSHITNTWEGPFFITGGATRPIVVYDADNKDVYVVYTDVAASGAIAYKKARFSDLLFDGAAVTLLAPGVSLDDATSTKQVVNAASGLLVAAKESAATGTNIHYALLALNHPPVAIAQASSTSGAVPLAVNFTGSGSSDVNGTIQSYQWTFGDGGTASTANPSHTYMAAGNYTAKLTVTDDDGATGQATVNITVTGSGSGSGSGTVVETRIAAGSDDAEEKSSGGADLSSGNLDLGTQPVGMRFMLGVPQGAQIVRAYVQFTVDQAHSEATSLTIVGEDSDNAGTFVNSKHNIINRPHTAASVFWAPPVWPTVGAAGVEQRTPDLSAIIQAIVSRPGWVSGHGLGLLITGSGARQAKSFERQAAAAALLHVEYTQGGVSNLPPVVNAGSAQTITLPTNSANLTGSVTDDGLPAGGTLTRTWSKFSGPGTVGFTNPNAAATTATFSAAGSYVLRLSANDGSMSASADVTMVVNSAGTTNQAPVVNTGLDQTITSTSANLTGSVTDDGLPAGGTLTQTWSKLSGPGTVTFANAGAASTQATFSVAGTYVLQLAASDSALSSSDDVTVTIATAGSTTVVETRIAAGTDDAEEKNSGGSMDIGSGNVDLGTKPSGMRFLLPVPKGAAIVRAYVQFVGDAVDTGATTLSIEGEASDNAPTFGSIEHNIVNRLRTFNHASWTPPAWTTVGTAGLDQRTSDLSPIIQEIVNRSGWTSGNGVALIVTGTGVRHGMSFERKAASAALLHVEYMQ